MVSVMRATSESGDAPGVRVTNPAMPHISDAVETTFLNSHTRRLVRRWPREDENGADGGRAVREVFCRTKPMMLSRLFSWFPRHIVPCTSGRWHRGNFRKKPMAIPLVDLRLGHNRRAQSPKEGLGQARPISPPNAAQY